jgi:hypothetical protein
MPAQRKWSSIVTWRWSWITGNSEIIPLCPQSHISGNVDSQLMRSQGALSFTDTQCSVMRPPSAELCCHPVQRNAATFGDHQRVCKVSTTPEGCGASVAVGLGRCPVRAQGSKVRFADKPDTELMGDAASCHSSISNRWFGKIPTRMRPSSVAQSSLTLCSIVLITRPIFPLHTCFARLRVKPLAVWKGTCDSSDSSDRARGSTTASMTTGPPL